LHTCFFAWLQQVWLLYYLLSVFSNNQFVNPSICTHKQLILTLPKRMLAATSRFAIRRSPGVVSTTSTCTSALRSFTSTSPLLEQVDVTIIGTSRLGVKTLRERRKQKNIEIDIS